MAPAPAGLFSPSAGDSEPAFELVTPQTADVQQAILACDGREGVTTVAERRSGFKDNFSLYTLSTETLTAMIEAATEEKPWRGRCRCSPW